MWQFLFFASNLNHISHRQNNNFQALWRQQMLLFPFVIPIIFIFIVIFALLSVCFPFFYIYIDCPRAKSMDAKKNGFKKGNSKRLCNKFICCDILFASAFFFIVFSIIFCISFLLPYFSSIAVINWHNLSLEISFFSCLFFSWNYIMISHEIKMNEKKNLMRFNFFNRFVWMKKYKKTK